MAGKTTRMWERRMAEAFDVTTGAEPSNLVIKELAKIMERTEEQIDDDDLLGRITSLMYEAYEAGRGNSEG